MLSKAKTTILIEKDRLVLPPGVQRKARIKVGDHLEINAIPGVITIVSKPLAADDEYTPEQRRSIDIQLAQSLEDVKKGRVYGPFDTVEELEKSLRRTAKKPKGKTKPSAR
jgi:bifunctional DNA-binding transcriptional regulator/antitoxin component of YhaV-PrlF toxin-antitoxin module